MELDKKQMLISNLFFRYKEVCSPGFNFGSEEPGGAGHFTQVVWKKSTKLGIGKATSKEKGMTCTYVVARYKPAGNYKSQFGDNVVKGSFNEGKCSDLEKDTQDIDSETGTGTAALGYGGNDADKSDGENDVKNVDLNKDLKQNDISSTEEGIFFTNYLAAEAWLPQNGRKYRFS